MSDPTLLSAAGHVVDHWAADGGPRSEYVIGTRGDDVLAIAEMAVTKRWDDAARRAALGAMVPLSGCTTLGYLADTTTTVDGRSSDALLCLELAIVDAAAGAVGAKAYVAPYTRTRKRFGTDVIAIGGFTELAPPQFGPLVGELAATWHLVGSEGRIGALNIFSEVGIEMSDAHPDLQAELHGLLAQHA